MAAVLPSNDVDLLENADEELLAPGQLERSWRGIIIALIVITVMCSLIGIAVLLITPLNAGSNDNRVPLTLDDVLSSELMSTIEALEWIDDNIILLKAFDYIKFINTTTSPATIKQYQKQEILGRQGRIASMSVSNDLNYMAVSFNDGRRAFVHSNNVYYSDGPELRQIRRITYDNDSNIYNGIADWIYEEEIFNSNVGIWWSTSGRYLAYISIDDREVPVFEFPLYENRQYPTMDGVPYPKTGVSNLPKVTLFIWDKQSKQSRQMLINLRDQSLSVYLFSASWISLRGQDLLLATFANRYQNIISITICTFETSKCILNYDQNFDIGGRKLWAEPCNFNIQYYTNDSYFVNLPNRRIDGQIYTQVAKIYVPANLMNGQAEFLPMGDYDVVSIIAINVDEQILYFIAATPHPTQRHLLSTTYNSHGNNRQAVCVTCNLTPNCTYQEAWFSRNANAYILSCRGPGIPRAFHSTISSNNSIRNELTESEKLNEKFAQKALAIIKYDEVQLSNGFVAIVKMLLPPNYDAALLDQKFPLIVSVYGGPGTQKANDEASLGTIDMLFASNMNYIVAYIDGRGSGMRGWKYTEPIYGNLGTVEVDDQIETIKILTLKHRFIDSSRVAIWGWSYGGFVAAHAVEHDTDRLIKCAASIAPVTNFKLYDATYTERYMGEAGELAYERSNLLRNVSAFRNVRFLLVHGSADDNVHLQNTAALVRVLGEQNIQFQLMVYPDANHSLIWARRHLFTMLIEFFRSCFQR